MHYPTRHPLPTLEDRIVAHLSLSPATRSQLCEALDTSRTNLGRALTTLLDEGSVVPVRSNAPGRGRPTQLLTLNASAAHAVGLLVTRTSCAAVMLRGTVCERHLPGDRRVAGACSGGWGSDSDGPSCASSVGCLSER